MAEPAGDHQHRNLNPLRILCRRSLAEMGPRTDELLHDQIIAEFSAVFFQLLKVGNGRDRHDRPEQGWRHDARLQRSVSSEEHTSELQSLMRISYAVFGLNIKNTTICSRQ